MGSCRHEHLELDYRVLQDVGERRVMVLSIWCRACRRPYRFHGVPSANNFAQPFVDEAGTTLRAPIEPGPADHCLHSDHAAQIVACCRCGPLITKASTGDVYGSCPGGAPDVRYEHRR